MLAERIMLKDSIDRMTDEQVKSLTLYFYELNMFNDELDDEVTDKEYEEYLRRLEEIESGKFVTLDEVKEKRLDLQK